VSETFPLEIRALAIAFFYAIGTGIGGIAGPWLFGALIDTGSRASVFGGYLVGAALMIAAGLVAARISGAAALLPGGLRLHERQPAAPADFAPSMAQALGVLGHSGDAARTCAADYTPPRGAEMPRSFNSCAIERSEFAPAVRMSSMTGSQRLT
jgi:MFS family permease